MAFIDEQLRTFKERLESAIEERGARGKQSTIRSSHLIKLIHEAVKHELIEAGVNPGFVFPQLGETRSEIKLAGHLKYKTQDVCVIPGRLQKVPEVIDWGPLAFQKITDIYGTEFTCKTLSINIRSQMSSLAKNFDTLYERTFAEAYNLHLRCPSMVLGEVYLIPTHEYDDEEVKKKRVAFNDRPTNIEYYLAAFAAINNRTLDDEAYKYERCALLIVDFRPSTPRLYRSSGELVEDGFVSEDFGVELSSLGFDNFASDILAIYAERHDISDLGISPLDRTKYSLGG